MKKTIIFIMVLLCISNSIIISASASAELNWYCKRESNHKTPPTPPEFGFISEMDAYSHDTRHTSYDDGEKVIYLTFDAGYENGNVEKILNILKEEQVTAAFFILGNLIERNTSLVKRMADEGHLVCNHTFSHKNMCNADKSTLLSELERLEALYKEKTGYPMPKYYRPPEGKFSRENLTALKEAGYTTVFWSFAYADWDNDKQPNTEKSLKKLKDNLHNGEIMLLHPTSATNAAILRDFIKYAKEEGFRFASLDELK